MNAPAHTTGNFCAAFGCLLFGVHGTGGKWYCRCHFNANPGLNDAITLEIGRNKPLVDRALYGRREHRIDIEAEQELFDLTREIGSQMPLAPVTGPTSGEPHFSEVDQ